jgi:hypothetical protein
MHWAFYTSWQLPHRRQGPRRRPLEDPPPVAGPSSSALACRRVTKRFAVDTSPEVARERFGVDLTSFSALIPRSFVTPFSTPFLPTLRGVVRSGGGSGI